MVQSSREEIAGEAEDWLRSDLKESLKRVKRNCFDMLAGRYFELKGTPIIAYLIGLLKPLRWTPTPLIQIIPLLISI